MHPTQVKNFNYEIQALFTTDRGEFFVVRSYQILKICKDNSLFVPNFVVNTNHKIYLAKR